MINQVLIVGAGPTGLALALGLTKQNIPCKIIDKNKGPGEESRAMVVQARILEFYEQLGIAENVIDKGMKMKHLQFFKNVKRKAKLNVENMGEGQSPFPYILSLPQDEHEKILIELLAENGVEVAWQTKLESFTEGKNEVSTLLNKEGQKSNEVFQYVCGCDGAHSTVRKALGFDFIGGSYDQLFYVADVYCESNETNGFQMRLFDGGFCIIFPIRTTGSFRLIGIVPELLKEKDGLKFSDIAPYLQEKLSLVITKVNWFSTYKVHHRMSEHFRKGRIFIAGDAGHVHSPAGGQGMNTGIGDAINLSWKLGAVIDGRMDSRVLDSYEEERMAFAKTLVSTTDRLFSIMVGKGRGNQMIRSIVLPTLIPKLTRFAAVRKMLFKVVSQIRIHYRDSMLSTGKVGKVAAGDRLPWVAFATGTNYDLLQSFNWQIHVYGDVIFNTKSVDIPITSFPYSKIVEKAGIKEGTVLLIRPDGHVAVACEEGVDAINAYVKKWHVRI